MLLNDFSAEISLQREGMAVVVAAIIYATNEVVSRWMIARQRQTRTLFFVIGHKSHTLVYGSHICALGGHFTAFRGSCQV